MLDISTELGTAIRDSSQYVKPKVIARFANSKYMDNLSVSSNDGSFSGFPNGIEFFTPYQSINTIEEQTFAYAVTDTIDENGVLISPNGNFYVCPDEYSEDEEFGWWSKDVSDGGGNFATDPYVRADFDQRKATSIEVVTAFNYGRIDQYKVEYVNTGDTLTTVGTFNMAVGSTSQEHSLGGVTEIKGVKITVYSTQNASDFARIHEIIPIYEVDISDDVVSFDVNKDRENYEDGSSPVGHLATGSGSLTLSNVSKLYNVDGTSAYAPYINVDTRFDISLGWDVDGLGTYEYVKVGYFYADTWNVESDGMTAIVAVRDRGKFMQETVLGEGYLRADLTAGEGIADLAKIANIPAESIQFQLGHDAQIVKTNPKYYWKLNESGTVGGFGGSFAGEVIAEEQYGLDGAVVGTGVSLGNPGLLSGSNDYSVEFGQVSGSHINLTNNSGLNMTGSFSVSTMFRPSSFPTGSNINHLFGKGSNALSNHNYYAYIKSGSKLVFGFGDGGTARQMEHTAVLQAEEIYSAIFVFDSDANTLSITLDGNTETATGFTQTPNTNTGNLTIGVRNASYSANTDEFDGDMSHFALYDFALTDAQSQRLYESAYAANVPKFNYLYGNEENIWEMMLQWATADLGVFYFDEEENFIYDYRNTLNDSALNNHAVSQYSITEDEDIVSASYDVSLQVNKVIVRSNPITTINSGVQGIWRAETGTSLAITESDALLGVSDTEVVVESTEKPFAWYDTGYIKMGNEIMSYSGKTAYKFTGLERDIYGDGAGDSHPSGTLVREVRVFNIEFSQSPAIGIKRPFITAQIFDKLVDVDVWNVTAFGAEVVVSANEDNTKGTLVILEGTNPDTQEDNFFSIAGIPLIEEVGETEAIDKVESLADNIRKYGNKELLIDNKFIQSESYAQTLASWIISNYGLPVEIVSVDTMGIPQLQLGDKITMTALDQLDIASKDFWIVRKTTAFDGGVRNSMVLRAVPV